MTGGIRRFLEPGLRSLVQEPKGQIKSLDGLRSMAILLVVATHTGASFDHGGGLPNALRAFPAVKGGWVGVDLFYVLSGFFIGKQLWKELQSRGTVNVGRFILRRGLRIWPLYLAVLLSVALIAWATGTDQGALWPELLFLSNYFPGHYVGGSWSLATEEQFYIIGPVLMVAAGRMSLSMGTARAGFLALLLLLPLVRAIIWSRAAGSVDAFDPALVLRTLYHPIHTHSDGLLIGLSLAGLLTKTKPVPRAASWIRQPCVLLLAAGVAAVILRRLNLAVFAYTSLALVFGALLWFCLHGSPRNLLLRVLSWKGFYLIARLSFGLYLVHQLVLGPIATWVLSSAPELPPAFQFAAVGLINLAASMAMAALGWVLVEHPFLRFRERRGYGAAP